MTYEPLSQEERDELLWLVTPEQKDFLLNRVKRGRKTIFGNVMHEEKVQAIRAVDIDLQEHERAILDWDIVDYVDFGPGNRIGKCACGISLRYMFTVQHAKTSKTISYGKDHLSAFLNLPIKDINALITELRAIDYELDELLIKIKANDYGYEFLDEITGKMDLPKDIQEHVDNDIPLLDRQIYRIEVKLSQILAEEEEKKAKERYDAEQELRAKTLEAYIKTRKLLEERILLEHTRKKEEEKEKNKKVQQILQSVKELVSSTPTIANIAYALVVGGISSAVEISKIIRDNTNVENRTRISLGSMNRPFFYTDVVLALMKTSEEGSLYFDQESSGIEDCFFYSNLEHKPLEDKEELQATLF